MARITRKELKADKFALEVEQTVDFFEEHRTEIVRYAGIALAVVALFFAVQWYRGRQQTSREQALGHAIAVQEAPIGQAPPNTPIQFATQADKDREAVKVFSDLAAKYSGSEEGYIAEYYLGCIAADQGKLGDADKRFSDVADHGSKQYSSLAKLSLGQIYFAEGRNDLGEKMLRDLMAHPTAFVSKEQATITLAKMLGPTQPAVAHKLLDPLKVIPGKISQTALQTDSELPPR